MKGADSTSVLFEKVLRKRVFSGLFPIWCGLEKWSGMNKPNPNKVLPSFFWNLHLTLVHCHTPSWSYDHKGNNADVVFYFEFLSEGELAEPLPQKSSRNGRLVDFQVNRPYQELQDQSINNSFSDDSCSLSLTDGVISSAGRRSFT